LIEDPMILLKLAKAGNTEAFEKLIFSHQKSVYNMAFRMLGNREDAYDASQEVFIRVFRALPGFREQSSLSTWIYRITKNVCLDLIRKNKNQHTVSIDQDNDYGEGPVRMQIEDPGPAPDETAEHNELVGKVREGIRKLPEQHRLIIIMRDMQNFSYEEIAKILRLPEGTVKSRINRARKALRDIIEDGKELL